MNRRCASQLGEVGLVMLAPKLAPPDPLIGGGNTAQMHEVERDERRQISEARVEHHRQS